MSRQLARLTAPDLAPYGLPRPTTGLKTQFLRTAVVPLIDVGLVDQLYAGRVQVVPAVASFGADGVVLSDGRELKVDVVVAATGYRRGLEGLVGHLGVLDAGGAPRVHGAPDRPGCPGAALHRDAADDGRDAVPDQPRRPRHRPAVGRRRGR